jgi:hypothetical protein
MNDPSIIISTITSAPDDALVLVYADDVGLRVHPDHHHFRAQSRLGAAAGLQPIRQSHVLCGEVPEHFLVHLVVE